MGKLAAAVMSAVVIVLLGSGCGGPPPALEVSYAGAAEGDSFRLVNASAEPWADVRVLVRGMRPDGVENECAVEEMNVWHPGDAVTLPRCGDEKTLVTIETRDQKGFFVVAAGKLYRKLGRREIPVS